jgi:enoyl-CoA hydratase/carnithine racemase
MATGRLFDSRRRATGTRERLLDATDAEHFLARVKEKAGEFRAPRPCLKAVGRSSARCRRVGDALPGAPWPSSASCTAALFESEDAREGIAANLEKAQAGVQGTVSGPPVDAVRFEDKDGARWITLDRPPVNVLDIATIERSTPSLASLPIAGPQGGRAALRDPPHLLRGRGRPRPHARAA